MTRCASAVLAAVCLLARPAAAADTPVQTEPSAVGACSGQDLRSYTIRSARVGDPFWMLRWRRLDADTLAAVHALEGKPYSFDAVNAVSRKIESAAWLPDSPDSRAEFSYSDIAVEDCRDRRLDVVFFVFSARVSTGLSSVIEWRREQTQAPNVAAGIAKTQAPFQFAPGAGFDPARRFYAGGAVRVTLASGVPFRSLDLRGTGSSESRALAADLAGDWGSSTAWLSRADWRLGFASDLMPAARDNRLARNRLAAQFSAMTRPFAGAVLRFGAMAEGGTLQSGFSAAELPAGDLSNTRYTSAKLFGGVTGNWRKQALASSFGLEFGSAGRTFHGGWRKLVGDLAHELWLPFGDARVFELEQRFSAGGIQNLGALPVAERFFGGSQETPFIPGAGWNIRANPVVRSIPANRLYLTAAGAGGDRYFSYNSTAAVTVWGYPVVPKELAADPQFQKLLNGAVKSQTSVLSTYYKSKDPHFAAIRARLPDILAALANVRAAASAARSSAPASLAADFDACSDALDSSGDAASHAQKDKPVSAFGWVVELLPDGLGPLADSVAACGTTLLPKLAAASVPAPQLTSAVEGLDSLTKTVARDFEDIDTGQAAAKAAADMSYVKRTLDVITRQMTITSVSPVFVFDVARLGPAPTGPYAGNRYGVGGGLRFTLVSTVSFTAGYAINVHRRPGEGAGAFFFSLSTRNLFE